MKLIIMLTIACICWGQLVINPDQESKRCLVDQTLYEELQLLKCEMMRMKEQFKEQLSETRENLTEKIDQVDASVEELKTGVNQISADLAQKIDLDVTKATQSLTQKIDGVSTGIAELQSENEVKQKSAFQAYKIRSGHGDNAYSDGDRIVYWKLRINGGGHYSPITGEYTCPVSGLYFMSYTVWGYGLKDGWYDSQACASVIKDGVRQGDVLAINDNTASLHTTLSQSLVLECSAGEKVWIESKCNHNNLQTINSRNVFSGFLITPD